MKGLEQAKLGIALGDLALDALVALDVISKEHGSSAEIVAAGLRGVLDSIAGAAEGKLSHDKVRDELAERVARAKRLIPDARAEIKRRKGT